MFSDKITHCSPRHRRSAHMLTCVSPDRWWRGSYLSLTVAFERTLHQQLSVFLGGSWYPWPIHTNLREHVNTGCCVIMWLILCLISAFEHECSSWLRSYSRYLTCQHIYLSVVQYVANIGVCRIGTWWNSGCSMRVWVNSMGGANSRGVMRMRKCRRSLHRRSKE